MAREKKKMNPARERVLVFLSFFTSPESQRAFAPAIPKENLAFELCRIWFDQVYAPGMRYMEDGLRGDQDGTAAAAFRAAFDDEEWKYLERFHRFLELRIDMMPAGDKIGKKIPENNLWESIVRDARYLYELLEPDQKKRKHLDDALATSVLEGGMELFRLPGSNSKT